MHGKPDHKQKYCLFARLHALSRNMAKVFCDLKNCIWRKESSSVMFTVRNLLFGCLFLIFAPIVSAPSSAAGLSSSQGLIQIAQAKSDHDEKKKKRADRKKQRGDARKTEQRQRADRRTRGPDRADQQRRRDLREQQQQRKALRRQRQQQKALKGEKHRRTTIDADKQRQQQLRQERERQRALREERQRQRSLNDQRKQQSTQRELQQRQHKLRQQQRKDQRQRAQSERRENIIKQTDRHTVRNRKRIDRRGRVQYSTSRHYRVRDRRYRNRYRNGRSIYFLPPIGITLAPELYYLDASRASYQDYVDLFEAPPVMDIPRRYTMDEIVEAPEVRSMVRSVNIDMITFASGSAVITDDQLHNLDDLANAMLEVLQKDQYEKFLVEGHTDATGPDEKNLLLSEERAAAVQSALIEEYGIPADNLEAVGYGEQYLLIDSLGAERRNRRVTIRAVGNLLAQGN